MRNIKQNSIYQRTRRSKRAGRKVVVTRTKYDQEISIRVYDTKRGCSTVRAICIVCKNNDIENVVTKRCSKCV
jgi:hypothetical protein